MASKLHMENLPRTLELMYRDDKASLRFIDQRLLPGELKVSETTQWREVIDAIKTLAVRGAPAIGIAGAAAVALWLENDAVVVDEDDFTQALDIVAREVTDARPTAVNLTWAVDKTVAYIHEQLDGGAPLEEMGLNACTYVQQLTADDERINRAIGENGAPLIPDNACVLTHCNAGSLATAFYGTALGVIYAAAEQGRVQKVFADETRPVGQGARLTVWELAQAGVDVTLNCDNMAATLMAQGKIDCVIVGADRIARNGDTANKIGTYGLAVLAQYHKIPFYVAAPLSTFDFSLETGAEIPIEQRDAAEVLSQPIEGVEVYNPAFDVTPGELVTAFITEQGVYQAKDLVKLARS